MDTNLFDFINSDNLELTLPEDCQKILLDVNTARIALFTSYWSAKDCKKSPKSIFVFGDNDVHQGIGGQAVIRNCKNAMGIPTKKYPNNNPKSFYTDKTYYENCQKILNAVSKLIRESVKYEEIVFPEDGFGTGLAKLPEKAPRTFKYLEKLIDDVFGIDYESIRNEGLQIDVNLPKEYDLPKQVQAKI